MYVRLLDRDPNLLHLILQVMNPWKISEYFVHILID
jgi:hypothetical protein